MISACPLLTYWVMEFERFPFGVPSYSVYESCSELLAPSSSFLVGVFSLDTLGSVYCGLVFNVGLNEVFSPLWGAVNVPSLNTVGLQNGVSRWHGSLYLLRNPQYGFLVGFCFPVQKCGGSSCRASLLSDCGFRDKMFACSYLHDTLCLNRIGTFGV